MECRKRSCPVIPRRGARNPGGWYCRVHTIAPLYTGGQKARRGKTRQRLFKAALTFRHALQNCHGIIRLCSMDPGNVGKKKTIKM